MNREQCWRLEWRPIVLASAYRKIFPWTGEESRRRLSGTGFSPPALGGSRARQRGFVCLSMAGVQRIQEPTGEEAGPVLMPGEKRPPPFTT